MMIINLRCIHQGKVLTKSDVIAWAMSDDINRDKVRVIYENDEIGIEHSFVTFKDGIFKL